MQAEIARCDNRKCANFGHITTVKSVHDGWDWDYAFGVPHRFEVMKNITECCENENLIEKDEWDLTEQEMDELEALGCQ